MDAAIELVHLLLKKFGKEVEKNHHGGKSGPLQLFIERQTELRKYRKGTGIRHFERCNQVLSNLFNRTIVIKYENIAGCNRSATYSVITDYSSRWYSVGFSVMLRGAESWYLPNTGALTVLMFSEIPNFFSVWNENGIGKPRYNKVIGTADFTGTSL